MPRVALLSGRADILGILNIARYRGSRMKILDPLRFFVEVNACVNGRVCVLSGRADVLGILNIVRYRGSRVNISIFYAFSC